MSSINKGLFLPIARSLTTDNMSKAYSDISNIVNLKESGIYDVNEYVCGKTYYPVKDSASTQRLALRQVYRKVIKFGALPDSAAKSVAHGIAIKAEFTVTELYGSATYPGNSYIPIPYSSPTLDKNISLKLDGTNVIITTGTNMAAYTVCRVVIEFLRN